MRSLKFLSLIVLCASSCLGLILPAVGLVSFPSQLTGMGSQASTSTNNSDGFPMTEGANPFPGSPTGQQGPDNRTSGSGWQPANGNASAPSPFGLPVSTSSPSLAHAGLPSDPSIANMTGTEPTAEPTFRKFDKLGLGMWLLLGPVWLISLLVWSVTPGPNKGK